MSSLNLTLQPNPFPSWIFFLLLMISMVLLSQLNFPGDKKPHGKMVGGKIRISVEIFSAYLGLIGARVVFDLYGLFFQLILTLIAFYIDRDRWKWFLGRNREPPSYVIAMGYYFAE